VGQEECPLSLTEEYRCLDRQRDNKERNMLLLTTREQMADISQIEIGEVTRRYSEEEKASLMKEITENNTMIIELQVVVEEKRQQESREIVRQREKEEEETNK